MKLSGWLHFSASRQQKLVSRRLDFHSEGVEGLLTIYCCKSPFQWINEGYNVINNDPQNRQREAERTVPCIDLAQEPFIL